MKEEEIITGNKLIADRLELSTMDRMDIFNKIIQKYSLLKKDKGIFHAQLFSAMEEYLDKVK